MNGVSGVRTYFVLMGAWWLGIVLLVVLANVYTFVSSVFSSLIKNG
jgi:hypothetical protein